MSNTAVITLIVAIAAGFAAVIYFLSKKFKELEEKAKNNEQQQLLMEWLKDMRGSLDTNLSGVQKQLAQSGQSFNERLDRAAAVIGEVQKHLGVMTEASSYIKDLHQLLQAPKLRGGFGEQVLNDIIKQTFPKELFSLQHQFHNGQIVDALIITAEGSIPIDAKFPMESFKRYANSVAEEERKMASKDFLRDCKRHVDDISDKYILPGEGTVDFAIMYVPAEPVAYEIIVNFPEIMDYAREKRITVVSPNQFSNFLKVIYVGIERQKVSEQAKQILFHIKSIQREALTVGEDVRLVNKHIGNAKNASDSAVGSFDRLEGKIQTIGSLGEATTELIDGEDQNKLGI